MPSCLVRVVGHEAKRICAVQAGVHLDDFLHEYKVVTVEQEAALNMGAHSSAQHKYHESGPPRERIRGSRCRIYLLWHSENKHVGVAATSST